MMEKKVCPLKVKCMLNKTSKKNSHSLYYTPEEKSSNLGLFSAARVVLLLNKG